MPIDTQQAIFSESEINSFLVDDGYKVGTEEFYKERARRYYPVGGGWAERDDWSGDRKTA